MLTRFVTPALGGLLALVGCNLASSNNFNLGTPADGSFAPPPGRTVLDGSPTGGDGGSSGGGIIIGGTGGTGGSAPDGGADGAAGGRDGGSTVERPQSGDTRVDGVGADGPQACSLTRQDCPANQGCYRIGSRTQCAASGGVGESGTCGEDSVCTRGLICSPELICRRACDPQIVGSCPASYQCTPLQTQVGYCAP